MKKPLLIALALVIVSGLTAGAVTKHYCEYARGWVSVNFPDDDPKELASPGVAPGNYMWIQEPDEYYWTQTLGAGTWAYQVFHWDTPLDMSYYVAGHFPWGVYGIYAWNGSSWDQLGTSGNFQYNVSTYAATGYVQILAVRYPAAIECGYIHLKTP